MTQTIDLITKLSNEAKAIKPMIKPIKWVSYLLLICGIYAIIAQTFLGLRPDLALQFMRPLFTAEIFLIFFLFLASIIAATLNIYPDLYQKSRLIKLPYVFFLLLASLLIFQIFIPDSSPELIYPEIPHKMICSACITFLSFIPAILIFIILKKGATIRPLQAGLFSVLASSSLGCLILRLSEANDSLSHILIWHYIPMVVLALIGTLIGKLLLKW
ncbi:MAG: hypothetical protein ACJATU_000955 [Rickettsiales bacterium]|jgi:hypothetical protein